MNENILDNLEKLIAESVRKRESFLLAVTKSSKSISEGASDWFESEVNLLKKEMGILKDIMPEDVQDWKKRLNSISVKFKKAISFLNKVIDKAEKGELTSIREVRPPPPEKNEFPTLKIIKEVEEEEEKKLDLVSAILDVFDAASDLEKLIKEVEKESKRTVSTARLVISIMRARNIKA